MSNVQWDTSHCSLFILHCSFVMVIRTTLSRIFISFFVLVVCIGTVRGQQDNSKRSPERVFTDTHIDNLTSVNSSADDVAPVVSADENTLYFTSYKSGKGLLYRSSRTSSGWGAPELFVELPHKENISALSISSDGKTAVMQCCNRKDGMDKTCDIYQADISGNQLTNIHSLGAGVNSQWWDGQPSISEDGQLLFFSSDRKHGAGGIDIYMCSRDGGGNWGAPVLQSFCTSSDELSPYIASDNQTLYFASNTSGGQGGYDIYVTYRTGDNNWSSPKNLGPSVNSSANELTFSIPPHEDALYISSDRKGGAGGMDIYRIAPNPVKPKPKTIAFRGQALDAETGQALRSEPATTIEIAGSGDRLQNTGSSRSYSAMAPIGQMIRVRAGADGYQNRSVEAQAPPAFNEEGFSQDIKLIPAKAKVYGHVTNVFTKAALTGTVMLEELDANGNSIGNVKADVSPSANSSAFEFDAKLFVKYRVSADAGKDYEHYLSDFTIPLRREALIRFEKEIRMTPSNIDAVMMFFDLAKYDLKPDQLEKLPRFIQQVKENPYVKLEVLGHTDDQGSEKLNDVLSEQRAKAVQDYLMSQGVPHDQLTIVKGFGKSAPLVVGTSDDARAKNRRVEIRIVGKQ